MYVCHLILLEKVISFTMMNNLWHIQKIRNTLFQPSKAQDKNPIFSILNIPHQDNFFLQFLPNLPQKVETVETLYYKLHLLSFWVKTPTLSQIEPYGVVVLLDLIFFNHWFDWMKNMAEKYLSAGYWPNQVVIVAFLQIFVCVISNFLSFSSDFNAVLF